MDGEPRAGRNLYTEGSDVALNPDERAGFGCTSRPRARHARGRDPQTAVPLSTGTPCSTAQPPGEKGRAARQARRAAGWVFVSSIGKKRRGESDLLQSGIT
jgi:hypothetical protein